MAHKRKHFIREKKIMVGSAYMETDIFSRDTLQDVSVKGTRSKKQNVSRPAQQNLNSKNARRYLRQLVNGNFVEGDIFLTLTYKDEFKPMTVEEAEKHVRNYLRRVARHRKRDHLEPLKYVLITEYRTDDHDNVIGRIHHHLLVNEMDRDVLEGLWQENRRKLGVANTRRMDPDMAETGNGFEGLVDYLVKDPKGKKRWSSSRNLKRPVSRNNDHKFSNKKIVQMANDPAAAYTYFSDMYPKWDIVSPIEFYYNELTDHWSAYLKMWRKPERR